MSLTSAELVGKVIAPRVTLTCEGCGRTFSWYANDEPRRFCSWECRAPSDVAARFWRKVDRSGGPDACWPWIARNVTQTPNGYGRFCVTTQPTRVLVTSNRFAWSLAHGDVPDGLFVLHRCNFSLCCNEAHLYLGTKKDNSRDKREAGRVPDQGGERNPRAVLTEDDVRRLRSGVVRPTALAKAKGLHLSTVLSAKSGRTWRRVS